MSVPEAMPRRGLFTPRPQGEAAQLPVTGKDFHASLCLRRHGYHHITKSRDIDHTKRDRIRVRPPRNEARRKITVARPTTGTS